MKHTQRLLLSFFVVTLALAATLYVLGDFADVDMALWAGVSDGVRFSVSTAMILFTLAAIPLALRLFRFRRVAADLVARKEQALACWGTLRLMLLAVPLVANTALYYTFGSEPAFGYLAVVALLCFPFVVPTMARCVAEVADPSDESPESSDSSENTAP